jgi:hypothetical protein
MRPLLGLVLLVLAGCSALPAPTATTNFGFPPVLNLENRGGPGFVVNINGSDVAHIACNVGANPLTPGEDGVPALPWTVSVTRLRDAKVVLAADVTQLPQWLVQIGESIGMGSTPVSGPAGPSCPP